MHFQDVNLVAVLVCGVMTMVVGFLWYSPALFAKPWVKEMGYDMNDKAAMDKMKKSAGSGVRGVFRGKPGHSAGAGENFERAEPARSFELYACGRGAAVDLRSESGVLRVAGIRRDGAIDERIVRESKREAICD